MVVFEYENMESQAERFNLEITFSYIKYMLDSQKTESTENSQTYILLAKEYFRNAAKSLDKMLDKHNGNPLSLPPYFMEISSYLNENNIPTSFKDADTLKYRFNFILESLDKLEKNPGKFYGTEDSRIILGHFENLLTGLASKERALECLRTDDE